MLRSPFLKTARHLPKHPTLFAEKSPTSMKIQQLTVPSAAAAAAYSCCILSALPLTQGWVIPQQQRTFSVFASQQQTALRRNIVLSRGSGSFALYSTLSKDAEETVSSSVPPLSSSSSFPSTSQGNVIAEGTIVSQYPGGLCAIRLKDDFTNSPSQPLVDATPPSASSAAAVVVVSPSSTLSVEPTVADVTTKTSSSSSSSSSFVPSVYYNGDLQGKQVLFADGTTTGIVVAHRPPVVFVYSTNNSTNNNNNMVTDTPLDGLVKVMDAPATISVSAETALTTGDVIDFLGNSIKAGTTTDAADRNPLQRRAIFSPIPQVKDIALINHPMLTGVTMLDTLAPMGRGQNMLLVGHDVNEMRGYAMDLLQTQIRDGRQTKCIYALTDRTNHQQDNVLKMMEQRGLDQHVHVIVPTLNEENVLQNDEASRAGRAIAVASAACALGEIFALEKGINALVVVDTIDQYKKLWDTTTRVLVDVFGPDAVVKGDREGGASSEMRAFYSSLIQRSAQYKLNRGSGSVTLLLMTTIPRMNSESDEVFQESDFESCGEKIKTRVKMLVEKNIPLTAVNLRKIDIPIPLSSEGERRFALQHVDDLISMSDGQIWLDERLEATGQFPPVDPQRSLTRIGIGADTDSRADAPALRRIAERLRLEISQAADLAGAEQNEASKKQRQRNNALLLAMHQKAGAGGRRLSESCVAILAASQGYLDKSLENGVVAGSGAGEQLIQSLMDHVLLTAPTAMASIDDSLDLGNNERQELTDAIAVFFQSS